MSEWKEFTLGEIADIQTGPFGSQLHASDYVDFGIPVIMPKNIGHRLDISLESIARITEKDAKRLQKYRVKPNDIVFSRRGDVEKCAFITDSMNGWLCGTGGLKVSFQSANILPRFMAYYFSTSESKHWLTSHAVGTTMPNLNSKILRSFPILLPPLPEQKAIAAVLSSLDDKIDLLHRQNTTLEAMAQTLFRHWFVDEASDEWEEGTLGDLVAFAYGKALKKSNRTGEGYPVIGSSGIVGFHSEYLVEAPGIVTGRKGTLGKVIYLSDNFYPIDTTFFIKSKNDSHELYFEYFLLKSMNFENMNTDSAVPGLNRNIALASDTLIPPQAEITQFNCLVKPLFHKILANKTQIQTLEKLRDTLLPKLMSGEVRVKF